MAIKCVFVGECGPEPGSLKFRLHKQEEIKHRSVPGTGT